MHPGERAERDALRMLASVPGMEVLDVGSATCFSIPALPDVAMVNHTVGIGDDEPAGDDVLDTVAGFYERFAARHYVAVTPAAPRELVAALQERGYTHAYDWMKFTRGTAALPRTDTSLDVRLVDGRDGDDFAAVVVAGYGMPAELVPTIAAVPAVEGCYAYVAYDGEEPAAAGAVLVSGDVAWLGFAATRPEHRRKGGQSAILAARLAQTRELGVGTIVTETGVIAEGRASNSYRNILRSGFTEAYVRENYLSPAAEMAAS